MKPLLLAAALLVVGCAKEPKEPLPEAWAAIPPLEAKLDKVFHGDDFMYEVVDKSS